MTNRAVHRVLASLDPYYPRDVFNVPPAVSDVAAQVERFWETYDRVMLVELRGADAAFICLRQAMISRVFVDVPEGTLVKRPHRFQEYGILAREVDWLRRLGGTGVCPRLIEADDAEIRMGYCGEPVFRGNLPADWREQAEELLAALRRGGCAHNDIKCENLTVADGRLTLIDFGFATEIGAPIPAAWPRGIGRQHRVDIHRFDDRKAIFEALQSAEEDRIDRSMVMPTDS